jgi:polysaccharide chain length determinant protein (PEP-CTERM system associated)
MLPAKAYKPEEILLLVWGRRWLVLGFVLAGALVAFGYARTLPDQYKSETQILVVPQRIPESYVRSTVTLKVEDRLKSITQQILSRTRLEQVILSLDLYPEERHKVPMEEVVEGMRKAIEVEVTRGDAFSVSFVSSDPRTAQKVTERLAGLFIEENLKDREVLAEATNQFLEVQLEEARQRLVEHEKKLEAYRLRHAGELPDQAAANLQAIQNYQLQIQALVESINRDRDRRIVVDRQIADLAAPDATAAPLPAGDDPTAAPGASAAQRLEAARTALQQMELRLKPEHPDLRRARRLIEELEREAQLEAAAAALGVKTRPAPASPAQAARAARLKELQIELESLDRRIAQKEAQEQQLRRIVASYQARIEAIPSRESELTALMRDYDTLQKQYTSLLAKREDAKIAADLERRQGGEQFRILDPARVPEVPFSPNRPRITFIGAAAGLFLALGLIGLAQYRDNSFRTEDEVVQVLALPVVALVPRMVTSLETRRARRRRIRLSVAAAGGVIAAAVLAIWRFEPLRAYLHLPW